MDGDSLRFYLFGPFEVRRGEHPLAVGEWRSRQTRLLARLLVARYGRVVTTDQLLEILWPDDDPQTARRRLYVRISELRRALDPTGEINPILTVEDGYALNREARCWVDVVAFEAQSELGYRHQEAGRLAEAIAAYEAMRSLYRGDFLEEDLYADWTFVERERLREIYLAGVLALAECYAQQGRYRLAIARCHQVLAADPCREAVYVRLMLYHYYAGEQTQALQAYDRCRRMLTDELEIEPLPGTTALAEQIRNGTLWAAEGAPRYPPPVYEGRLYAVPYSLGRAPFIGREREYAWLIDRWRDPECSVIWVEGEAGIGKTRLAHEFLGYALAAGTTVLSVRVRQHEELPYGPVVRALRSLRWLWDGLDMQPGWLAVLSTLFPELRARSDLPQAVDLPAEHEQERLLEAMEALLRNRFPPETILFVDDAHCARSPTIRLLARVSRSVKVVLACRSEETPADHPLRVALRPFRRVGHLAELALEPLQPEAVGLLLSRLAQADLPDLVGQVVAQTEGNPLFIIALLQHLFDQGMLYVDGEGGWLTTADLGPSLPPTVQAVIEARLRRLSLDQRRVFDLAAVAGGDLSPDLLRRASDRDETWLLDILDALLEAGLLVEPRAAGEAELAIAHSRYTEVAYGALPGIRRRQLHRRVAEALEATAADLESAAPALADHWQRAGDPPRAFDWLVRAGDAALSRYAGEEALGYYQQAVALEAGETAPIWARLGRVAHHLARYAEGADYYRQAIARWEALGEAARQVEAHYALAECHRELSQFDQAAEQARLGLEMAVSLPEPALAARGHIILSNALRSGQLAPIGTVRGHLEQALALARPVEDWQSVGEATFWLGVVAVNQGDLVSALSHDREALTLFRHTEQAGWQAIALNNLAYHALLAGQPELARQTAEEGLALARQIGSLNTQGWLLSTLGEVQTHLGRLDDAQATLEQGLALVERWGPARLRPGVLADLARLALVRQAWHEALEHLQAALALALESAPQFVPRLRIPLAEAYLGAGGLETAKDEAQQAQQAARDKGQRSVEGQAWRALGSIYAAAGQADLAEQAYSDSLALLDEVGDALEAARTQRSWGLWLRQRGDGRGEARLQTARDTFERCGAQIDLILLTGL